MKNKIFYKIILLSIFIILNIFLQSCKSAEDYYKDENLGSIGFFIKDNHNLSTFESLINMTPYKIKLFSKEQYNLIAPTNESFSKMGLNFDNISLLGSTYHNKLIQSYVLSDPFPLGQLPVMKNQILYNQLGHPLVFKRWLNKGKEVITINGIALEERIYEATNGKIYILKGLLPTKHYSTLIDLLEDNVNFTLFTYAIKKADIEKDLKNISEITLYAPSNQAMAKIGLSTFEEIANSDKLYLRELVFNHMQDGMNFYGDFAQSIEMDMTGTYLMNYINAGIVNQVRIMGKIGSFHSTNYLQKSIKFDYIAGQHGNFSANKLDIIYGMGKLASVHPIVKDIPFKNGVVHQIDNVLLF